MGPDDGRSGINVFTPCGPFGGESGRVLRMLIEAERVALRAVASQAVNGGYVHDRRGGERRTVVEMRSGELGRHEIDDLYDAALTSGLAAAVTVLTGPAREGVVPAAMYRRLARDLGSNGARVVADVSGATLKALDGGVHLLKVSHEELIAAGVADGNGLAATIAAIKRLHGLGFRNVVVSRAHAPALALIDQRVLEVVAPCFEPRDHRGAGDSMTAALAVGVVQDLEPERMLQLAAAAGALNVTRHGLGTGRRRYIEDVAARVCVRAL